MTHSLKNRRVSYIGGSTVLSIPPKTFEAALAKEAEDVRLRRQADQDRFDQAKAAYFNEVAKSGLQSTEAEAMRRGWRRVEIMVANIQIEHERELARLWGDIRSLRREAAALRVKLRASESDLLCALTNGPSPH